MLLNLAAILLSSPPVSTALPRMTTAAAKQKIETAIGDILQGKGTVAQKLLQSVPSSDLSRKDQLFRQCALSRLSEAKPAVKLPARTNDGQFIGGLLGLYQTYWAASALHEASRPRTERALVAGLSRLLHRPKLKSIDAAEPLIAERLKAADKWSQEGRTGLFHDLMIWSRNTQKLENVPLPEGAIATRVNYLDGFISRGWSSYFTCDRSGTGGWTTSDGLFVIVPSYDNLTDENFRVNLLAHESQHYSDKKRFGELPSWRLEYRAKLVELAYANDTRGRVLERFNSDQSDDIADPHSYANKRVLAAMMRRLGLQSTRDLEFLPVQQVHSAAIAELASDTQALRSRSEPISK